ncbi:MAG: FAD binding domain-containing protein [Chloroflexi bacterium]|nr:FAD binding domain-containing protein [Chloroflexota bacterium]
MDKLTPIEMTNSHLLVRKFDYLEATTVEEALSWLEQYHGRARLLAGGTDLIVMMKMERLKPEAIIYIANIPGLNEIKVNPDGSVTIGPLVTIHTLAMHPHIRCHFPGLSGACLSFGSTQIETMGTIGGNLCNGSPASDTAPVLLALNARLTLTNLKGKRILSTEEFFLSPGKTALKSDEMLTEITLPAPQPGSTSVFLKASRVVADLAKASLAIAFTRQGDQITACRVAMGAVAPTPILLPQVAKALIGKDFSQDLLAEAGALASETISPIDDIRSSAWYRRRIANVMLQDAMNQSWPHALELKPSMVSLPKTNVLIHQPIKSSLESDHPKEIEFVINGSKTKIWVRSNELLLNVLRDKLELTGTKYACGIGECSACTIQMNGKPILSCLVLAISAAGKEIITIEGLQNVKTGKLDPLQEAFIENTAFQCGYCTPGVLMTAKALLAETPDPDEEEVRHYLRGNNCRCTGYASIVRAVLSCADHQE